MKANDHPYKVTAVDSATITANDHPFKVLIEGGVVTPEQFAELEAKVNALATDLTFKGSVPTYDDLPSTADDGDTYLVTDTGILYTFVNNEPIPLNDAVEVIDNLNSTSTTSALSANQGKVLKGLIDTLDTPFTGADGTTAGTKGLVPAPTTADKDKFLKGDGTWKEIETAQSDWDENDSTSAAYVQNRTHYTETTETTTDIAWGVGGGEWVCGDVADLGHELTFTIKEHLRENSYPINEWGPIGSGVLMEYMFEISNAHFQVLQQAAYDSTVIGFRFDASIENEMSGTTRPFRATNSDVTLDATFSVLEYIGIATYTDMTHTGNMRDAALFVGKASEIFDNPPVDGNTYVVALFWLEETGESGYLYQRPGSEPAFYTSVTTETVHQLDNKYVKIDGDTITINDDGELEANVDSVNVVQTTGTSTTDVMSQNAVTEALASAGGIKTLTTADYNYPASNPTGVALWLLDSGVYIGDGTAVLYYRRISSAHAPDRLNSGYTPIITIDTNGPYSDTTYITIFGQGLELRDADDNAVGQTGLATLRVNRANGSPLDYDTLSDMTYGAAVLPQAWIQENYAKNRNFIYRATSTGEAGLVPAPSGNTPRYVLGTTGWRPWDKADWEQNDSSSNAYILNKPFYTEAQTTETTYNTTNPSDTAGCGSTNVTSTDLPGDMTTLLENENIPNSYGVYTLLYSAITNATYSSLQTAIGNNTPISFAANGISFNMESETEYAYYLTLENISMTYDSTNDVYIGTGNVTVQRNGSTLGGLDQPVAFVVGMEKDVLPYKSSSDTNYTVAVYGGDIGFDGYETQWGPEAAYLWPKIYSSASTEVVHQLDSKYINIDGTTIINNNGTLSANLSSLTPLTGEGAPTTETEGYLGQLYIDTSATPEPEIYILKSIEEESESGVYSYNWGTVGGGIDTISDEDWAELFDSVIENVNGVGL